MTGTAGWFFTFGEEVRRTELSRIKIADRVYQLSTLRDLQSRSYGNRICNPVLLALNPLNYLIHWLKAHKLFSPIKIQNA